MEIKTGTPSALRIRHPRLFARARNPLLLAACSALLSALLMGGSCNSETAELSVNGIMPQTGSVSGDQPIRITGTGFRGDVGYTVYFGSERAPAVTILDPQTLAVVTPAQEAAGAVDVTLRADNGPAFRIPQGFRYDEGGGATKTKKGNLGL